MSKPSNQRDFLRAETDKLRARLAEMAEKEIELRRRLRMARVALGDLLDAETEVMPVDYNNANRRPHTLRRARAALEDSDE